MRILLLDHYDSYTHILGHYLETLPGVELCIRLHDRLEAGEEDPRQWDALVLSPGPGSPANERDIGAGRQLCREWSSTPVLGICMGMQELAAVHGAAIVRAPQPAHGRISRIRHYGDPLFAAIPETFEATRYHSLQAREQDLPPCLVVLARALDDGVPMALKHVQRPHWGVQFHPESIGTPMGRKLLENFLDLAKHACARVEKPFRASQPTPDPASKPSAAPAALPVEASNTRSAGTDAHSLPTPFPLRDTVSLPWRDPETVFLPLFAGVDNAPGSFWLDSSAATAPAAPAASNSRSFMGRGLRALEIRGGYVWPSRLTGGKWVREARVSGQPFALLDAAFRNSGHSEAGPAADAPFTGGWMGFLGYEMRRWSPGCGPLPEPGTSATGEPEDWPSWPEGRPSWPSWPEGWLLLPELVLAFDHAAQKVTAYLRGPAEEPCREAAARLQGQWESLTTDTEPASAGAGAAATPASAGVTTVAGAAAGGLEEALPAPELSATDAQYLAQIEQLQEHLRAGDIYQACLTREYCLREEVDPLRLYRTLRRSNPAPYAGCLQTPWGWILSASPERFLRSDSQGRLSSRPIKGTRPRGATPREDSRLRRELVTAAKDRAENRMILDLLRSDLARSCEPGSITVPEQMVVEAHPTVFQLVSEIRGQRRAEVGPWQALGQAFPGGSMTGAPKLRAMEILSQLERRPRGVYSGVLGYLDPSGAMDWSIVIRTLCVEPGQVRFGAGGAILADSSPHEELQEAGWKAFAMLRALHALRAENARPDDSGAVLPQTQTQTQAQTPTTTTRKRRHAAR